MTAAPTTTVSSRIARLLPTLAGDVSDEDLLRSYGHGASGVDRPWVRLNFVASIDGAVTSNGRSADLGTPADARLFDLLRRPADVVLVGAGTVRIEHYGPMALSAHDVSWRRTQGKPDHPILAVVSGRLDLDAAWHVFADAPVRPIIYTTEAAGQSPGRFGDVADVVAVGEQAVDPLQMLADLHARGHRLIHCEGGPTLAGQLLACDAVDELCLTVSPRLEAGRGGRVIANPVPTRRQMALAALHESDSTLLMRYVTTDPGARLPGHGSVAALAASLGAADHLPSNEMSTP